MARNDPPPVGAQGCLHILDACDLGGHREPQQAVGHHLRGYGVHQIHVGRLLHHVAYDCAPVSLALGPNGLSAACSHGGWQVWLGQGLGQYV